MNVIFRRKATTEKISTEDSAQNLKQRLLSLIEKADFLVEDDLNALMEVLPDKDKLLLKVKIIVTHLLHTLQRSQLSISFP